MKDVNSLSQGKYNKGKSPRIISTHVLELQISHSICAEVSQESVLRTETVGNRSNSKTVV